MTDSARLFNVCVLGVSFMLLFTGFHTLTSLQHSHTGVLSLAIVYSVMALFSWAAPSLLVLTGPTSCLMLGAAFYILYCFQLLYTSTIILYSSAVLLGAGASIIWVAQGFVLANNSNQQDQLRNSGLFWFLFHLSGILGNIPVLILSRSYQDFTQQAKNLVGISSLILNKVSM